MLPCTENRDIDIGGDNGLHNPRSYLVLNCVVTMGREWFKACFHCVGPRCIGLAMLFALKRAFASVLIVVE